MTSQEAFEQACEYLQSAEHRMHVVLDRASVLEADWFAPDGVEQLELLGDAIKLTRRALSQAEGWLEHTLNRLEIEESEDDDTGAGETGEGPRAAL